MTSPGCRAIMMVAAAGLLSLTACDGSGGDGALGGAVSSKASAIRSSASDAISNATPTATRSQSATTVSTTAGGGSPDQTDVSDSPTASEPDSSGIPSWVWLLLALILISGGAGWLLARGRGKSTADTGPSGDLPGDGGHPT